MGEGECGRKEAQLCELISHSVLEEVGVHGSRLLRLAKMQLLFIHRLESLLPLGDSGLIPYQQFTF